jgi:hypothetical protein
LINALGLPVDKPGRSRHIRRNTTRHPESQTMSTDPERITILAREFTAAALEFHRGKMAEKGYRMKARSRRACSK